jgi:hypothetical protein
MKAIICGSRDFNDQDLMLRALTTQFEHDPNLIIGHGAARGADSIADAVATVLGIPIVRFHANWKRDGKAAGPLRNRTMYDTFKPNYVLAFSTHFETSRGTRHMAAYALSQGCPVVLIERGTGGMTFSRDLTLEDVAGVMI